MNSVLLDTSFLISLSDPARAHHAQAVQYYRECVHRQVPMYLSTIVISEFQVRQSINDLPLRNFVVLPFNVDHAMRCGLLIRGLGRDPADDRVRVKDDFKLVGGAMRLRKHQPPHQRGCQHAGEVPGAIAPGQSRSGFDAGCLAARRIRCVVVRERPGTFTPLISQAAFGRR